MGVGGLSQHEYLVLNLSITMKYDAKHSFVYATITVDGKHGSIPQLVRNQASMLLKCLIYETLLRVKTIKP